MQRDYTLTSCPVPVFEDPEDDFPSSCNFDCDLLVHVHEDGAEYGVWIADALRTPACGHSTIDIAKAEQRSILGIDDS